MLIVLTVTAGAVGLAAYVWVLGFRRRVPRLETQDLTEIQAIARLWTKHPNICFEIVSKLTSEERELITQAFLQGPDFQWMTRGGLYRGIYRETSKPSDKDREDHKQITRYMVNCILTHAEGYGNILVARDAQTGAYLGSACWIPPYFTRYDANKPDPLLAKLHFMRSVIPLGYPVPYRVSPGAGARFDAFSEAFHKNEAAQPKWWLLNLAVAPVAQGRRVGSLLLQSVLEHAKYEDVKLGMNGARGHAIYLECHDENVAFYEKFGFKTDVRFALEVDSRKATDLAPSESEPFYFHEMVAVLD